MSRLLFLSTDGVATRGTFHPKLRKGIRKPHP